MRKTFKVKQKRVIIAAIVMMIFGLIALYFAIEGWYNDYMAMVIPALFLFLLLMPIAIRSILIYRNCKVHLDHQGIGIVNMFGTSKFIPWQEVEKIHREDFLRSGIFVKTKSGKKHKIILEIIADPKVISIFNPASSTESEM